MPKPRMRSAKPAKSSKPSAGTGSSLSGTAVASDRRCTEIATLARGMLIAAISAGALVAIPKLEGMRGFVRAARDFYGELDHATPWPKPKPPKKEHADSDEDDSDADADIATLDDN